MPQRLSSELLAEFIGTMVLILFGNGVVAMVVLFDKGGYTNITLAWGLGVTMGIYIAGQRHRRAPESRGHAHARRVSRIPVAQSTALLPGANRGSVLAAALVYWNYRLQFLTVDPTLEKTAGVFTTFPAFPLQPSAGLLDQIPGHGFAAAD